MQNKRIHLAWGAALLLTCFGTLHFASAEASGNTTVKGVAIVQTEEITGVSFGDDPNTPLISKNHANGAFLVACHNNHHLEPVAMMTGTDDEGDVPVNIAFYTCTSNSSEKSEKTEEPAAEATPQRSTI